MKTPFYIFGAGGHGSVVVNAAIEAGLAPDAILDDTPHASDIFGCPIFASADFPFHDRFRFVVALGDPVRRREKFNFLIARGGQPELIIHPRASISRYSTIAPGTVVFANVVVDPSVHVHENCILNGGAMVGHDSVIERDSHVSGGAIIGAQCHIGERAFIGLGARVNTGVNVGHDAFIAIGAVVSHNVPPNYKAISSNRREAILLPIHAAQT